MAQRRMFSLNVVDTDAFLDMPSSTQALYFHLAMRADDDGFVSNPKKIIKMLGNNEDDYKLLILKKFIIPFDSGVCVIKHWLIHNLIRSDRYTPTQYNREKDSLIIDKSTKKYSLKQNWQPNGNQMVPQYSIDKYSINNSDKSPIIEVKEEIKPIKSLYEQLGIKQNLRKVEKWQDSASIVVKELNVPEEKISSVFKCFKDNEREAMFALRDCKELGKMNVFYFLKIYSELIKKNKKI